MLVRRDCLCRRSKFLCEERDYFEIVVMLITRQNAYDSISNYQREIITIVYGLAFL